MAVSFNVPPLRSSWISRPRLVKRMDEGFDRKFTLISAPAGFGKTTLLVDWIHKRTIPAAWFSMDKGDNAPLHFLTYVVLGLQTLEASSGKAVLAMLQSPQPPPNESILISLINDVIHVPTDIAFILDDYHLVDTKQIHDFIAFLLENLPDQVHLIITTRSDPPLPLLARLRSQTGVSCLKHTTLACLVDPGDLTASPASAIWVLRSYRRLDIVCHFSVIPTNDRNWRLV